LNIAGHEFPLRDVALYGVAECDRSERTGALLAAGQVAALGNMMGISHDGDRVARWTPECEPYAVPATDAYMDSLVERSSALEPLAEAGAALWQQPGSYGCSTPEIDLMVDRALACRGVLGAQLSGAGLGGCIMVLVRKDCADELGAALVRDYYEPQDVEPRMFVCQPSQGSQVLTSVEAAR
jgi:galactokinase